MHKGDKFEISWKTYCNWFYNSWFIRSLSHGFSLQGERVFHLNLCVLVCDWYFGLFILGIISFGDWLKLLIDFLNWHKTRLGPNMLNYKES